MFRRRGTLHFAPAPGRNGARKTLEGNDAMAWSTPEVREVCVGMEVTSYLSAEM
ncbi:MAG: pyrroloquinoline quinone precursor peptide PqqA [Hyphomicrobiales bacterium]|nr:pyrroloquinoline quinone precursor peptide PqqA [Hyphomicrobiales bacterium]